MPDLSGEVDLDLVDYQDYKFTPGEVIEYFNKREDKRYIVQIEIALDEMLFVKHLS